MYIIVFIIFIGRAVDTETFNYPDYKTIDDEQEEGNMDAGSGVHTVFVYRINTDCKEQLKI